MAVWWQAAGTCCWTGDTRTGLLCSGTGRCAEPYDTNRALAYSLSRCPSIFLSVDIKGIKSAHQLRFAKVLEEALKDTIPAIETDHQMKQL